MKNVIRHLAVVTSLVLGVNQAHAEGTPGHAAGPAGGTLFEMLDTNGDGSISKAEFDAFNDRHFKQLDTNKDGKITPDEMQAFQNQVAQRAEMGHGDGTTHLDQRFYAADANHDGGLDRQEAVNMPMLSKYFDEVDTNKDGKVTRQEYFDAMPLLHGVKKMDISGKSQSM